MKLSDFKEGMKVRFAKNFGPKHQDYTFKIGDIIEITRIDIGSISLLNIRTGEDNFGIPLGHRETDDYLDQFEPTRKNLSDLIMR
jgi:hypothetical protein